MTHRIVIVALFGAFGLGPAPGQSPPPAINPAQARLSQVLGAGECPVVAVSAAHLEETLVAANERGLLLLWPRASWLGIRVADKPSDSTAAHPGPITALACGSQALASAGADRKIHIWALAARESRFVFDTPELVRSLAIAPDAKRLAAGDDRGIIALIDTSSGKSVGQLTGHGDWILCLAFSADGTKLVSGCGDGQAIVWDVANGKKLLELQVRPAG